MRRYLFPATVLAVVLIALPLAAQEGPRRGKIKSVTPEMITITADGRDVACVVTPSTRFMGPGGQLTSPSDDKGVKAGADVMFLARPQDGKSVLIGLKLAGQSAPRDAGSGPGEIRRGKISKIDVEHRILKLNIEGREEELSLADQTQVLGSSGATLSQRFEGLKEGAEVFFKATKRDGKLLVLAIKPAGPGSRPSRPAIARVDTSKLRPLTALGKEKYQGYEGGLYPDGKNQRPAAHEAAGLAPARQVQPVDLSGKPSKDGSIVLLSVGMSNTSQISNGFEKALAGEPAKNPRLVFVNGAQGGMTAAAIQDPDDHARGTTYWTTVAQRLKAAGVGPAQVQVVWIKEADAGPHEGFPAYAQKLQEELTRIVQLLPVRFPNIKLAYLSSRTYAGFATTPLNPEPYAYESGFSVKWLIAQQLNGDPALNFDPKKGPVKAPWLSWGPYLWGNGVIPRSDGYRPEEADYGADGTHHAGGGIAKLGAMLLAFFRSDSTTRPWFLAR